MIEESVELPASGIERVLLCLCDTWPDKRAAFLIEEIEERCLYRLLAKCRIVVPTADDFATEQPDMIAVSGQCFTGQPLAQQIDQKGFDEFDNALSDDDIAVLGPPGLRPLRQVRAESVECYCICRDNGRLADSVACTTHVVDPFTQCLPPLPRICL